MRKSFSFYFFSLSFQCLAFEQQSVYTHETRYCCEPTEEEKRKKLVSVALVCSLEDVNTLKTHLLTRVNRQTELFGFHAPFMIIIIIRCSDAMEILKRELGAEQKQTHVVR
jgi:hypothetical protein